MSNQMIEAADAIRRAAKQYEVYVKAAEALERLGSIEQAAAEAEKAAAAAVAKRDAALAALAEVQAEYTKARQDMAEMMVNAEQEALLIRSDAAAAAEQTVAAAKADAILAAGNAKEKVEAEVAAVTEHLESLQIEVSSLSADRNVLIGVVGELNTEKAQLEKAIETLKAKFA